MGRLQRNWLPLVLLFFFSFSLYSIEWEHTTGPGAGRIRCFAVKGSTLFTGLNSGGIYRSTDNGDNWVSSDSGLPESSTVNALLALDNAVLAATSNGIFTTSDNGDLWKQVTGGLNGKSFTSFVTSGSTIFAGSDSRGVFISTNGGTGWKASNSGFSDSCVHSLAICGTTLLAGTRHCIYRSTNNGSKWSEVKRQSEQTFDAIICSGSSLLAGANPIESEASYGYLESTDNGTTWKSVSTGLKFKKVQAFAACGTMLFAGTWGEGVFRSSDNGKSWTAAGSGLTCADVYALAVNGSSIIAGTDGGVFQSTDNGASWKMTSSGITRVFVSALTSRGTAIYAGTEKDGVFLSEDNGHTWNQTAEGLTRNRIFSLTLSNNKVFAGTDSMGIFRASGEGLNWSVVGSPTIKKLPVLDLTTVGTTIFAEGATEIYRSTDDGERWSVVGSGFPKDAGFAFAKNDRYLFTGAANGMYRSSDNGATWTVANTGIADYKVLSLAVLDGSALFAGTYLHGIYKSTDDGTTWKQSTPGWTINIDKVVTLGRAVFAMSGNCIFASADTGRKWTTIHPGIDTDQFLSLTAGDGMLLVGTRFNGIWRRRLDDFDVAVDPSSRHQRQSGAWIPVIRSGASADGVISIGFTLDRPEQVAVDIYTMSGRHAATPVAMHRAPAGNFKCAWNCTGITTGCYMVRVTRGTETFTGKTAVTR